MSDIPAKPTDLSVEPKVIAAGYTGTGTNSIAKALDTLLDGPVLHGGNALYGREDEYARQWYRVLRLRKDKNKLLKLLREVTVGYVALTDVPAALFIPELLELYPDAKVVLVDRDTEKWWNSVKLITQNASYPSWALRILLWPCFTWRWIPFWSREMASFIEEQHGKDVGKELKSKHNALVRASVPKKALLEMQITDGWAPLCNFLKKPVPSQPFPDEDDAEVVDAAAKNIFSMAITTWLMYIFGYGIGVVGLLYWLWTQGKI